MAVRVDNRRRKTFPAPDPGLALPPLSLEFALVGNLLPKIAKRRRINV